MNTRSIIAALTLVLVSTGANAQNRYVSQEAAEVLGSDKYYISMAGRQSGGGMTIDLVMEAAAKGSSAMTRMSMSGFQDVTLYSGGTAWTLDEDGKTWSSAGGGSGALNFGKLTFRKQYGCKIDGKPYYYDEYSSSTGMSVNLFYDSGKVSAIEVSSKGQVVMAMWLHSCSACIPSNMYFTLTPTWKASDGSKAPPTASEAWKDSATRNELACGTRTDALVVTDRKPLASPVYASNFGAVQSAPAVNWRTTAEFSIEGILAAGDKIAAAAEGMTNEELLDAMLAASDNDANAMFAGQVTGDLIEYAVARAALVPMPFFINGACALIMQAGKPEVAEKMLQTVYDNNPEDVAVACNLVECYIENDKIDQARKVLPKIIEIAPNIGQLHQLYATTYFAKGDIYGAMDELCMALAGGYCSDITAYQLKSITEAVLESMSESYDHGSEIEAVIGKLFSERNRELLKKAVKLGLEKPSSGPAIQDLSWKFNVAELECMYPSLQTHLNDVSKLRRKINGSSPLFFTCHLMGYADGTYEESIAQMQAAGQEIDTYEASNCWALYMLQFYYRLKFRQADDEFVDELKPGSGWAAPGYHERENRLENIRSKYEDTAKRIREKKDMEFNAYMNHPTMSYDLFVAKWELETSKEMFKPLVEKITDTFNSRRDYYQSTVLPLIREYWEMASELAPYLVDENSQRYFISDAKVQCMSEYEHILKLGIDAGKDLREVREALSKAYEKYNNLLEEKAREHIAAWEEHRAQIQQLIDDGEYFANSDGGLGRGVNLAITLKNPLIPYECQAGLKNGHLFYEKTNIETGITTGRIPALKQNYTREIVTSKIMTLADEQRARMDQFNKARAQYFYDMLLGMIPVVGDIASAKEKFSPPSTTVVREVFKTQDSAGNIIRQGTRTTSTTDISGSAFIKTTTEASRHTGSYVTVMRKRTHIGYIHESGLRISIGGK